MKEPYGRRCSKLLKKLRRAGCGALLVSHPVNARYLSGFPSEGAWLLVAPRRRILLTDSRFTEEAERSCPGWEIREREGSMVAAAAGEIARVGEKAGFEAAHLSVEARDRLAGALQKAGSTGAASARELKATSGLVESLRMVKDEAEIEAIRRAARVAERAMRATLEAVSAHASEREFAVALEYRMRSEGAEAASFPTIAAAEPTSSLPHARPGEAAALGASSLLVDWGARLEGYNSDLTRVVARSKLAGRISEIWRVVTAGQRAAVSAVKAGVRADRVDRAARKVIEDAGYGECFGHGAGHGVGLEVHEAPALSPRDRTRLRAGMVVTVEPGIYLPGVGGVRLEDMVVVRAGGAEVLTRISRKPRSLGKRVRGGRL